MGNGHKNKNDLVERIKSGSEDAFAILYGQYHQELCNYITAISGDLYASEDIVQQTFIKLWSNREKLNVAEDKLKQYLFKISYNLFIDTKRKQKKENKFLEKLKHRAYLELLETDTALFEERLRKVEAEIENLPDQCKLVFILSKKEGLKYKEISERLHISIKTVEVHMAKALKRLRAQLSLLF